MRITLMLLLLLAVAPLPASSGVDSPILVVGDSLSAGYGVDSKESWVALLRARLAEQGYGHPVVNASISGDTTRGGHARLPRALSRHDPGLVVIELGGNDGLRGIPVAEMRSNLAAMITASQTTATVLLVGIRLPPNYGPSYTERFYATFQELAAEYDLALVPFLLQDVALKPELMQADGIHPNASGQRQLLENVWPYIERWLRSTRQ